MLPGRYCIRGAQAVVSQWGAHHPLLLELYGLLAELDLAAGDHRGCLTHRRGCLSVRRPLRPYWRPFWLRFTYVMSVLVEEY